MDYNSRLIIDINNDVNIKTDIENGIIFLPFLSDFITNIEIISSITFDFEKIHKEKIKDKDIKNKLGSYKRIKKDDILLYEKCIVCFENYKAKEGVRKLVCCDKNIHKKCLDKWLKKSNTKCCPLCRAELLR